MDDLLDRIDDMDGDPGACPGACCSCVDVVELRDPMDTLLGIRLDRWSSVLLRLKEEALRRRRVDPSSSVLLSRRSTSK